MKIFSRILVYIKPYWLSLTGSILCIIFYTIFNSLSLFTIGPFLQTIFSQPDQTSSVVVQSEGSSDDLVDSFIPKSLQAKKEKILQSFYEVLQGENRKNSLKRICFFILTLFFFKSFFGYFQIFLMAQVEQSVIRDLRNDLYKHINELSLAYFHKTRTGQIISRITNDVTLINNGVSAGFVTLVKNPLTILVLLSLAVFLSWKLTIISLVIAPISLGVISIIGHKLRKQSTHSQEKMADVTSVLQETISGIRVVKAFAMEKFEIGKFTSETQKYFKSLLKITRTSNLASPLTEFLGTSIAVAILYYGGQQVLKGELLAPEQFIMFLVIIFSLGQPIKELSSVNNRIQEALAAGERVFRVLDTKPIIYNTTSAKKVSDFRTSLEFKNVSFYYNKKDLVLKNISVNVEKGNILAIVGPSGGGKSTLVDLIPRFYDPIEGQILLDNIDLIEMDLASLRRLMGIVTQETILFNDTVRNNIAYGETEKSLNEIIEAAKIANAHQFISNLPNGYDTNIGERGVTLSGGQRQRLAIARAVLKNPPILILDEATSALDTESELLVQQAIERLMKNRTSFVIAHRLSTILHADQIIVLDKGEIVQAGTHAELQNKPGLYQKLYNMQFRL